MFLWHGRIIQEHAAITFSSVDLTVVLVQLSSLLRLSDTMRGLPLIDYVLRYHVPIVLLFSRSVCLAGKSHGAATVRSLLAAHDGSPIISVIAEFDNDNVDDRMTLLSNMGNDHVHTVHTRGRFVTMDVDVSFLDSVYDGLSTDPHFHGMVRDSMWEEQGVFVNELPIAGNHVRGRQRQVQDLAEAETSGYGIAMIQADQVTIGSTPTTVCVVDTGVASGHPDLDFTRINGADRFSNIDNAVLEWDKDTRGHGTHTVGIISAITGNGVGIKGVGNIPVYVTRGLNDKGLAKESDILEAIEQCEAANAKIISLSLAGPSMNSLTQEKLRYLYEERGFLILAASGNQGGRNQVFPASDPFVISVTAVTANRSPWHGSNYGPWVELAGPGDSIISTSVHASTGQPTYSIYSGTSMATPFVAAAAALLWSHFPTCTNTQIRYALAHTAVKNIQTDAQCSEAEGYGIVQTKNAYDFLAAHPCAGATWGQQVSPDGMCSTIDVPPSTTSVSTSPASAWTKFLTDLQHLGW
jgi:subtilisin family serine protease